MGIIHGHFDVSSSEIDDVPMDDDQKLSERVNTGIAIVVPMHKIREVIEAHIPKASEPGAPGDAPRAARPCN